MSYENIRFSEPHMVYKEGYFYMMEATHNILYAKLPDGSLSFSYPSVDNFGSIKCLQHTKDYFWSLHDEDTGVNVKAWYINNNLLKLDHTFSFTDGFYPPTASGFTHIVDCDTFAVDNYESEFKYSTISGSVYIDMVNFSDVVVSGTQIKLGPNTDGRYEFVTATGTLNSSVLLSSGIVNSYDIGDPINFYKHIWFFNNRYGMDTNVGAVYTFDAHTEDFIGVETGILYKGITALTYFYTKSSFDSYKHCLVFVRGSNIYFVDINDFSNFVYMIIDNVETDDSIITVYGITCYGDTVYRLQLRANYFGADYTWSTYNYQVSTIRPFVDAVTLGAYPLIIPANGYNTLTLTAVVTDQYGNGMYNKPVYFEDTDAYYAGGYVTRNPAFTDVFYGTGRATTYYRSGVQPKTVTITATATQYD